MAKSNYIPSKTLVIEKGKIYGRQDFEGKKFGTRQFAVFLDTVDTVFRYEGDKIKPEDLPRVLEEDGWNIGWTKSEEPRPFINVKVVYRNRYGELRKRPPRVTVRNMSKKTEREYKEDDVDIIDDLTIDSISVVIISNPYEKDGKTKYSAWAREICAYAKPQYYFDDDDDYMKIDD